jgi:FtsH-binding integral membrane protein
MAQIDNRYAQAGNARTDVVVDEGLRAYMLRVYNYMAGGILLTGLVAYFVFTQAVTTDPALAAHAANGAAYALKRGMYLTSFGMAIFASPLKWVVMLAPLGVRVLPVVPGLQDEPRRGSATFWLFAAVMGLSLSSIFLVFTGSRSRRCSS